MRKKNNLTSAESILLTSLNAGQSFYTEKQDKDMTAIATYYNIRIKTERLIIINHITLNTNRITKVTIQ